jgi:hypothetical protein
MPVLAVDERTAIKHGVLSDDYLVAAALEYDALMTPPQPTKVDSDSKWESASASASDSDDGARAAQRRTDLHDAACAPLLAAACADQLACARDMPRTLEHKW